MTGGGAMGDESVSGNQAGVGGRAGVDARAGAQVVLLSALGEGRSALSEHESKQVLAAYGIPVTAEALARTREEFVAALSGVQFPVVLKIDSPDILHKTEAGLVALGCGGPEEALAAYDGIVQRAAEHFPAALVNGVLIQEMVEGAVAECIVGMKKDPQFGPTILFGLGGIFVEVFEDVALRVAPLEDDDARAMIRETKGFKLLNGARGRAKADLASVEDVLLRLSQLALDLEPYLAEIDINPLMVGPEGGRNGRAAVAADALILLDRAG